MKHAKFEAAGARTTREIFEEYRKIEQSKAKDAFVRRIVNLIVLAVLVGACLALIGRA